jgi:FKBP-type peptidyl-prolyl cis-trans isomerase
MTRTLLAAAAIITAASLTSCDQNADQAAKPVVTKLAKTIPAPPPPPAKPKIDAATLPGAPVTGEGAELGDNVLTWTITEGTGEMLPTEPTTATMKIAAWSMNGTQFFGGADGPDELVLPTSDAAAFSGWATAIRDMKVGETRKVWVSHEGRDQWPLDGAAPQDLVMDITLVSIGDEPALPDPLPGTSIADAARNGSSSGLRWYDLAAGSGAPLASGDTATIRCSGWLADGTPWQATGGMPVSITLDDTITPALAEGLVGMTPGSARKLIVPPSLGVGFNPIGSLPAGSMLILDIEYVEPTETTASAEGS